MKLPHSFGLLVALGVSAAALAQPEKYGLSPNGHGEIQFTVDAPLDSIVGLTRAVAGGMTYDFQTGKINAEFSVELSSFRTGISLRDQDLADQFFEVARFPVAVLKVEGFRRDSGAAPSAGDIDEGVAFGTLSLHGVERKVAIPSKIQRHAQNGRVLLSMHGDFIIPFSDYNIQRPRALFLKLGDRARVSLRAVLIQSEGNPGVEPVSALEQAASLLVPLVSTPPVAHATGSPVKKSSFRFPDQTPAGRGERLFRLASVGGPGNAVACASCHGTRDERLGIVEANGTVLPSRSVFDSAKRPSLWQGLAKTPAQASSICAKLFMLRREGLPVKQQADLAAYLGAISPDDAVPALDYRILALTRRSTVARPTQGKRKRGLLLTQRFCGGCHGAGQMRPPLTPGLYEPDYLIQRVRWLPGHDARQMPPMYVDRLSDSDLRHIVTYLAGDESKTIFNRKHHASLQTH